MNTYPAYKDSGEQWLGQIPEHWEMRKSKYIWQELNGVSETGKEQLLSVSQYDGIKPASENSRSESCKGYKIVAKDNLVINIMLAWLGGLGVSGYEGIVSPAYCVYRPIIDVNTKFLHYLYKTPMYLAEFARHSTGVVPSRWRMYTDDFGQVITLLPPLAEQEAMVAYLDEQTGKIDAAIEREQKMIDLLEERKQIIIQNAVTKGINPDAKMKDSGIEWIGNMPEHWEVKRGRYIGSISHGVSFKPNDMLAEGEGVLVLRASNIQKSKLSFTDNVYISRSKIPNGKMLLPNDILICGTNGSLSLVGKSALITSDVEASYGSFMLRFRVQENPQYIQYQLMRNVDMYRGLFFTSTINQLTISALSDFLFACPPKEEQQQIVSYLKENLKGYDRAIEHRERLIALLQERKQIIINEVVTGKIKVS